MVMTAYEHGFMMKCAEYGVDGKTSAAMLKYAQEVQYPGHFSIDYGLDQSVGRAARWAGRNWDRYIKPIGSAVAAAANPIGGAISGYRRGGILSAVRGAIDPVYRARRAYSENSNPGMQPVQPGAKAIQQNGKLVNPREIAERYAKQHGWNTNPGGQQPAQQKPQQPKLTSVQQQAQDHQNNVNQQISSQQAANRARADEQARLDAEWRAKHPAPGTPQQPQQPGQNGVNLPPGISSSSPGGNLSFPGNGTQPANNTTTSSNPALAPLPPPSNLGNLSLGIYGHNGPLGGGSAPNNASSIAAAQPAASRPASQRPIPVRKPSAYDRFMASRQYPISQADRRFRGGFGRPGRG